MTQPNPSRRGRPPRTDGPATRDRILDAALAMFSEHGFEGATIRQIAAKVGVSDPALYAHFKGKRDIFQSLMQEAGPDLLGAIAGDVPLAQLPAHTAIPDIFARIVANWTTPRARAFTSMMLRMGPDGIGSALKEVFAHLTPVFDAWQTRGDLRQDIPIDVAIWQVIGPLSGLRLTYLHGDATDADIALATDLTARHLALITDTLTTSEKAQT